MKSRYIQYYVEGKDEVAVVNVLKTKMGVIKSGRVQKLNVIEETITSGQLMMLRPGTTVVLVFDIDTGQIDILNKNLKALQTCPSVSEIITIPQIPNLEGELVYSCNIKNILQLLNSKSREDFKHDIIRTTNLAEKLQEHQFSIEKFWSRKTSPPYEQIENMAHKIKK